MTLTFEHYLDRLKMNRLAKYLGQRSLRSKVLVLTQTDTHIGPIALLGRQLQLQINAILIQAIINTFKEELNSS